MRDAHDRAHVERFRELVAARLGLHFDDGRLDQVTAALTERVEAAGAESAAAYLDRLATPSGWRDERGDLARALTVSETYFFRNPDHFRAFVEVVLPDRIKRRAPRQKLRVLSAGCASGAEAYTLAIVSRDYLGDATSAWDLTILGVDINPSMIEKAKRARYSAWALRATPTEVRDRCFRRDGNDFALDASYRAMASFEEHNLVDDDAPVWRGEPFDVVFCRNTVMYWSPDMIRAAVARFARVLCPGGYLFLGHAETLRGVSNDFHLCHTHDTFYYQQRDAGDARVESASPVTARPVAPMDVVLDLSGSWVDAIQRATERIATLADDPARQMPASRSVTSTPRELSSKLAHAAELMRQERFGDAMELLSALPPESRADPDAQLLRAVLLTNSGDLAAAERLCAQVLERDELNAGAHYLMALCREHAGDRRAAVDHDQAAVYLDPGFAMPRLHMGLMAKRADDLATARRELGQALVLLAREDASRILLLGGGFSREALAGMCRAELRACGGNP